MHSFKKSKILTPFNHSILPITVFIGLHLNLFLWGKSMKLSSRGGELHVEWIWIFVRFSMNLLESTSNFSIPPMSCLHFLILECICTHYDLFCVTISCLAEARNFTPVCEFIIILPIIIFYLFCDASHATELLHQLSVMTSRDISWEGKLNITLLCEERIWRN